MFLQLLAGVGYFEVMPGDSKCLIVGIDKKKRSRIKDKGINSTSTGCCMNNAYLVSSLWFFLVPSKRYIYTQY